MDTKASLWTEYRHSFAEFSQKVQQLQALTARANPDPEVLTAAARSVQQARALYLGRRDALAQRLLRRNMDHSDVDHSDVDHSDVDHSDVDHSTMWESHSAMASSAC